MLGQTVSMEEVEDENARGQVRVRDFGRRLANQVNTYIAVIWT